MSASNAVLPVQILLVDDDPAVREAVSEFLTDEGFAVRTAINGADALLELAPPHERPALILLDLAMPVMNGHELLRRITVDPRLAPVPVLVLSATIDDVDARPGLWLLRKPLESAALVRAIHVALGTPPATPLS